MIFESEIFLELYNTKYMPSNTQIFTYKLEEIVAILCGNAATGGLFLNEKLCIIYSTIAYQKIRMGIFHLRK